MFDVEVASGLRSLTHEGFDRSTPAVPLEFAVLDRREKLQLFGVSAHRPRESSCPCAERRVSLLRIRASIAPIVQVEDTLMRCPSPNVVEIPALPVVNCVLSSSLGVFEHPTQERYLLVVLPHERMAEFVAKRQSAKGTNRVHEEGVRTVERIYVSTAARDSRPASCLNRTRTFDGQLVEVPLPLAFFNLAFVHQPEQVPISADVIEPVVMHPDVRHMRGHERYRMLAARF